MSIVKITIERVNQQKYETQMDCTKITEDNRDIGDSPEDIAMLLIQSIKAVFGEDGDLFCVPDILIQSLAYYRPPYREYLHAKSICEFFDLLNDAWINYDCDNGDFIKYFKNIIKKQDGE